MNTLTTGVSVSPGATVSTVGLAGDGSGRGGSLVGTGRAVVVGGTSGVVVTTTVCTSVTMSGVGVTAGVVVTTTVTIFTIGVATSLRPHATSKHESSNNSQVVGFATVQPI
ncbi:MAG TPA: hypothetical protein DEP84_27495 [Chloroflexi bacterium]|nr:hypothetical protein [Chloroflexota bacterium]